MSREISKIEEYILNHIKPEGSILSELNRKTYLSVINPHMITGHLQGKVLKMFSEMIKPKNILEIGTFTGYSAICLASGLQVGGRLHTIEINDEITHLATEYFTKAGLDDKITLHIGDALEIVPKLNTMFDIIYIDADKRMYSEYYDCVFNYLNIGGYIIVDDVLWYDKVIEDIPKNDEQTRSITEFNNKIHNDTRVENVILQVRDGLSIIRKL